MDSIATLLQETTKIVKRAGEIIIENNKKPRTIRHKGRNDLVTDTDIAVEEMLKKELLKLLPESTFLAEESAKNTELTDFTWIIDPLDGTTNFAHGLPMVATSVALWANNDLVLGVVNLPLLHEIFTAHRGGGACLNDKAIHVSNTSQVKDALIATGFPYAIDLHLDEILAQLKALLPASRGIRRPGAAALDLAYVACGRYDGFYERALNPWDTAAGILLVEEAGGTISQYTQEKYSLENNSILATNGQIHTELSTIVSMHQKKQEN